MIALAGVAAYSIAATEKAEQKLKESSEL